MPDSICCVKIPIHWEKWMVLTTLTHPRHPENCHHSILSLLHLLLPFFEMAGKLLHGYLELV